MLKDHCISVTDLRKHTKQCLENLGGFEKYIFVNNKPIAVLLDIDLFEEYFFRPQLIELSENELTPEIKKKVRESKKMKKSDFISI